MPGHPPVLLGFADALAAPESAFSLLDAGYEVTVFARRGSRPPLRHVRALRIVEITAPQHDALAAAEELRAVAERIGAVALMPLDDLSLWLCTQPRVRTATAVVGPTPEVAQLALDKRLQLRLAGEAGFALPASASAEAPDALDPPPPPVVLKGALAVACVDGRLGRAPTRFCETRADLRAALAGWPDGQPLLAQEFVAGDGEGVFGLRSRGITHAFSGHRRIRMMNPRGSGSSACRSRPLPASDVELTERFLRLAGWDGLFMVELVRRPDGEAVFMELNGRAWGSMALARRLRLEYPAWAVAATLDGEWAAPAAPPSESLTCRHLGRELVHLLTVLRGPRHGRPPGWPSRAATLRAVLRVSRRGERWYNWRPGEGRFFLADATQTVRSSVAR